MEYTIYHIPGIKIGCTSQLKIRMRKQGFTEWEILETHTDIYEASNREIQLQKDYGLPVDTIPYWKSVEKSNENPEGRARGGRLTCEKLTHEQRSRGAINSEIVRRSNRIFTVQQIIEIRSKYIPRKYTVKMLADEYSCSYHSMSNITQGLSYKDA